MGDVDTALDGTESAGKALAKALEARVRGRSTRR